MAAKKPAAKPQATPAKSKSLGDFRAEHDKDFIVPLKIREGLAKLGPSGWDYETEFARLCGVGMIDLSAYRDAFAAHVVETKKGSGKRAWAGSKALADKMRAMVR